MSNTILGVAVVAAIAILLKPIYLAYFSPLSKVPSAHPLASFTRLWLVWLKFRNQEHRTRFEAHERLGPVVRIAPRELSFNCVENGVQAVYGANFDKGPWYQNLLNYGHTFMFAMTQAKPHSERRRMVAPVYTKTYIQHSVGLSKILNEILFERLVPRLQTLDHEQAVEMHMENKAYATDVVTSYFFGLSNGTDLLRDDAARKQYGPAFLWAISAVFWMTEMPNLTLWLRKYGIKLFPDEVFASLELLEELCTSSCAAAQKTMTNFVGSNAQEEANWPVVYAQLYQKLEKNSPVLDQIDSVAAAEMLDHIQASHEAVGITITYLMWELSKRSSLQGTLRESFKSIAGSAANLPDAQALENLPLLDAILMETMRVYPAAFGPFTRLVPSSGTRLANYPGIPANTTVSATAYALHRNDVLFPDPLSWRPERWLCTKEQRQEMLRWFWTFGSGSRMCIGNHLAVRMVKSYVFAIYSQFETMVVGSPRMEQIDGLMAPPVGNELLLRFVPAV